MGWTFIDTAQNALSKLPCYQVDDVYNFFVLLVVDLMHDFELGVWKALFAHLIRLLYSTGKANEKVNELNKRCAG